MVELRRRVEGFLQNGFFFAQKMVSEEDLDKIIDPGREASAVSGAFHGDQGAGDPGFVEQFVEVLRLRKGNQGVLGSVDDESGGVVLGDMGNGGGVFRNLEIFLDGAADELAFR